MQQTDASFSPFGLAGITAAEQHEPFAISAQTSLQDVRPLTLKHGDSFGVFDNNGDALSGPVSAQGLYYRDTRHLSHFSVVIDGARPLLLSSTLRDDNATLTCDLDFADLFEVRGRHRERRGETHPPQIGKNQTVLSYTGLDKRRRSRPDPQGRPGQSCPQVRQPQAHRAGEGGRAGAFGMKACCESVWHLRANVWPE
jgi:hypothetical protein